MKFLSSVFGGKHDEGTQPEITDDEYIKKGKAFLDTSWDILHSPDNWKLEKRAANGDTVHSKYISGAGKIFKLVGEVNFSPKKLIDEIFYNLDSIPQWNPTILSVQRLKMIGECTDLLHYISAPVAGGLISSRDFVCVRHFYTRDGCTILGGGSVPCLEVPVSTKHIRGECGAGCHILKPIPGVNDRCILEWLVNIRMNGWLPQYLVDMGLTDAMFDYVKYIRNYGDRLREKGLMEL